MTIDVETTGEAFTERIAGNVVPEEEDVRDVLAKVTLGDAGQSTHASFGFEPVECQQREP